MDRLADPTEHLPNSYVSRRSTEPQAPSDWTKPTGALGELTDEAHARAATLRPSIDALRRRAELTDAGPSLAKALRGREVAVIAEVKRSSPSYGLINPGIDVEQQVRAYESG